jgi:hypothetical protein
VDLDSTAHPFHISLKVKSPTLTNSSGRVRNDVGTLVSRFSDGSNIEQHKLKHDRNWKIASHVICGVAVLVSSIGVFGTAFIGAAPGLALTKTIISVITKEQIAMYAASAGLFNSGATVALNFGSDLMGPKNYVSKMTETLKHSQTQNQDQIVDRFDAFMKGLLSGNNSELTYLVRQGRYANSTSVLTPEHNKQLWQRWAASYVSSTWNLEGTYIVMSDTGNCESDSRGFKGLRVCLEEAPQYVFYTFSKSVIREGTNHKALIRGPIGHADLQSFTNFTLQDVVRASFVYSKRHGYSPNSGAPEGSEDMLDSFFGPESAEAGGKAHGLFNIPILYSPGGQAISSINTPDNRSYPCVAAALPWSENSYGQPRSLQERDEAWTENDPETMFQFLNVTGFYRYGDWWGYCHGKGENHGNHCRGDKNIDWTGKFGKGQYKKIRHPFKHCKARKGLQDSFVGCEGPKNNGYDNNKPSDCAGRPGMEPFVAEGSTQWVNGTAYEADGMGEDEGEMSDWTDGEDEADADDDNDDFELHTPHDNKTGIASRFYA